MEHLKYLLRYKNIKNYSFGLKIFIISIPDMQQIDGIINFQIFAFQVTLIYLKSRGVI
jgi:hypothetical protein